MSRSQAKPNTVPDVTALLRQAGEHHRRAEWREAEALYRAILQRQPDHFDALHLCGVLMHQCGQPAAALKLIAAALKANAKAAHAHSNQGLVLAVLDRHAEALASYERAIALKPEYPEALNNRGNALRALGRCEEALASFERAIALRSDYAEAYNNRGNALAALGRGEEALASYDAALALNPRHADALVNRAQVLRTTGRAEDALASLDRALILDAKHATAHALRGGLLRALMRPQEAVASFSQALALKPDDVDALAGRANTHYDLKSFGEALADYDRVLALRPDYAEIVNNRGNALRELGRHQEALAAFARAISLKPDYAGAFNNRGNVWLQLNRPAEALADYDRALALEPDYTDALVNRGSALQCLDRLDEAAASFDRAIAVLPDLAEARWNKALLDLLRGDFGSGLPGYEWRWRRGDAEGFRNFTQPQWRGEDLNGRTILLHAEQGFGDTLQMVRYVPMVAARGGRVVLEAPDALLPLLADIEGITVLLGPGSALPGFDLHCPLMSLPLAFGTTLETIPGGVPYLRAPSRRVDAWRARLDNLPRPCVGLVWSGKPSHKNDHNRSIPLAILAPVLRLPGLTFVSLQREYRDSDRTDLARWPNLRRFDHALNDFADTAALIAQIDLVVAVDTAAAHLAGAMGKPLWVLLSHIQDWRWLLSRADSPWYPTARLLRQPQIGDWDSVITKLAQDLAAFSASR
jgi:tetratricopeptide (TPR) repeat protein